MVKTPDKKQLTAYRLTLSSKRKKPIIAIDGPAGSGKSSTSRAFAKFLKIPFIDTGAMYRAVTYRIQDSGHDFSNVTTMVRLAKKCVIELKGIDPEKQKVYLDGQNITRQIREPELTAKVVFVAREPRLRRILVSMQQRLGRKTGGVVEGRDIGTVVFPRAPYKFYFEASLEIRAQRRCKELLAAGKKVSIRQVKADIIKRDKSDYERKEGPLKRAKDAILMDTTGLTIPETIDRMLALMLERDLQAKRAPRSRRRTVS